MSRPVLVLHRMAVAVAEEAPDVAKTLDEAGRKVNRAALRRFLASVQATKLLAPGDPAAMMDDFFALLWGGLLIELLMGVTPATLASGTHPKSTTGDDQVFSNCIVRRRRVTSRADVCIWHKPDLPECPRFGRYRGQSGPTCRMHMTRYAMPSATTGHSCDRSDFIISGFEICISHWVPKPSRRKCSAAGGRHS